MPHLGYFVIPALCTVFLVGCSEPDGPTYLPLHLKEPSSMNLAEEIALSFSHRASTETFTSHQSQASVPPVHVREAFVSFKPDHVLLVLKLDVTYTHGVEKWNSGATPKIKDETYTAICAVMVKLLAQELEVPEEVIRVNWQHFNVRDSGTFVDGELTAKYPEHSN